MELRNNGTAKIRESLRHGTQKNQIELPNPEASSTLQVKDSLLPQHGNHILPSASSRAAPPHCAIRHHRCVRAGCGGGGPPAPGERATRRGPRRGPQAGLCAGGPARHCCELVCRRLHPSCPATLQARRRAAGGNWVRAGLAGVGRLSRRPDSDSDGRRRLP